MYEAANSYFISENYLPLSLQSKKKYAPLQDLEILMKKISAPSVELKGVSEVFSQQLDNYDKKIGVLYKKIRDLSIKLKL